MNKTPQISLRDIRRVAYFLVAVLFVFAGLPLLNIGKASAATQLASRSITLSDSSASAGSITSGVGSGSNVSYQVAFNATAQASSLVIDFCSQDPIINDVCTTPTGFSAASATLANATSTGQVGVSGNNWTITAAAGRVKLADDGTSGHDIQAVSTQKFEINAVVNPSTVGTFYARIYTYSNTTWGTYAGPDSVANPPGAGNFLDYGGIALSTTAVITITARVQEQLTFCVTSADPNSWTTNGTCSDPVVASNLPAITLGHGTPTPVLDSGSVDTGVIWTQLSTNATHGAVIKIRNSNLTCGGLSADGGTTCAIPPVSSGTSAVPVALPAGTAAFGLFVATYTPTSPPSGSTGSVTPSTEYNDGTHTSSPIYYNMDTNTANNNAISTYGSTLATTATPTYAAENEYTFAATAALTTPAGIYTANMSMIATGTF